MSKDKAVPEADGLNLAESTPHSLGAGSGGRPFKEPKRKRGYHRALKRGEIWAHLRHNLHRMSADLMTSLFYGADPEPRRVTDLTIGED